MIPGMGAISGGAGGIDGGSSASGDAGSDSGGYRNQSRNYGIDSKWMIGGAVIVAAMFFFSRGK